MAIIDSEQQIIVGNGPNDLHSFPDNWQMRSLGEITTLSQYGISSSSGGNYSVPILKMNNLQDGHIDFRDLDYIQLSKAQMESLMLIKGDLLINRTNSIDLVGKTAIYDLEGEHVFASYLVRFRLAPSVLPTFVNYYLNSEPGQRKLKLLATQGVSQANINPSILKKRLFIPIPPILEQHRIVEILYSLDDSIDLTSRLIAKKRDLKQATMQQLLIGKMRLPGFSGEWEVKKLGEIAEIVSGGTPSTMVAKFWNGNIKWCTPTDITRTSGKYLTDTEKCISELGLKYSSANLLPVGSLLLCSRATIGEVKIAATNVCTNQGFKSLICSKVVSNEFLYYVFLTIKPKLIEKAIGSTFLEISKKDTASLEIALPPLPEQRAIATILSDMDAEIVALEQKRDKMRALKQGMMQELLTGKTRLL